MRLPLQGAESPNQLLRRSLSHAFFPGEGGLTVIRVVVAQHLPLRPVTPVVIVVMIPIIIAIMVPVVIVVMKPWLGNRRNQPTG